MKHAGHPYGEGEASKLPAIPASALEDPIDDADILEGEIVDDPQDRAQLPVVRVVRVVLVVVRHEHTRTAGRNVAYAGVGAAVVARRLWESRTTARYERMIRAAEQTGNHQAAMDWDQRRAEFVRARHDRRMQRRKMTLETAKALPWIAGGMLITPFAVGTLLAVATKRVSEVVVPVEVIAHIVEWVAIAVSVSYGPVLLAAPWVSLAALWHVGRKAAGTSAAPSWARTALPGDDIAIDESTIAKALEALRIPAIRDYLKGNLPLQYIVPCRVDGRGTYAQIRLPKGVTAEKIARRRADLATGLYRSSTEVWPSTGGEAGILDLWVADKGALAEGAGPYPLLGDGFADVFKGLPFGKTLRGDPIRIPVIGRNSICGGMPEQGKSSAARIVACGYTLDITTEVRIYVPDVNYDFEVFRPRCSRYVMGAEDEHIEQILAGLEDLKDEVQRRGQLLVDHQVPEVTRQVAATVPGLHPMYVLLEEAHVAIQHPKYGKDISQLLIDIVRLDRKRGIHLKVSTQAPTSTSMPRDVTRNCTVGIAFAVGDHVANDALLGQGAYAGGHRATELIPGTDRGTALCKGFTGQRSEMVQVYFVDVKRDHDEVTPIVQRALDAMRDQGRAVPGTERGAAPIMARDLLADLNTALGSDRVRLADVPGLLRKLAPSWGPYRDLNGTQLRDLLDDEGVRVTNTGNVLRLDPADLRRVVTEREHGE